MSRIGSASEMIDDFDPTFDEKGNGLPRGRAGPIRPSEEPALVARKKLIENEEVLRSKRRTFRGREEEALDGKTAEEVTNRITIRQEHPQDHAGDGRWWLPRGCAGPRRDSTGPTRRRCGA